MLTDYDWALTVLCEESRPDAAVTVSEWADEHRVLFVARATTVVAGASCVSRFITR